MPHLEDAREEAEADFSRNFAGNAENATKCRKSEKPADKN